MDQSIIDRRRLGATVYVYRKDQLLPTELHTICTMGTFVSAVVLKKALMAAHPKRFYKGDLLNRILREVQKVKYGADQDSMNMMMRKGREYEANGGVFEISLKQLGSNTHLEKVYMHPKYIF